MFHLPFIELRRLHRRALRAQKRKQREVVGLLVSAAEKPNVLRLVFLENVAGEPGRWEVRREQIARVRLELRERGHRIRGLFHSHPLTEAILGTRDRQSTPTGWAHLVYDVCGSQPRLFIIRRRNGRRRVEQLALSVGRSGSSSVRIVSAGCQHLKPTAPNRVKRAQCLQTNDRGNNVVHGAVDTERSGNRTALLRIPPSSTMWKCVRT